MTKNTVLILVVATIALVGGIVSQSLFNSKQLASNDTAVDFSLPDLTGKQRHISEWKGKIVIINFWATWCPPCLKEIPEFIKLQHKLKGNNLQFIGIAVEDKQSVTQYINSIKINYPILIGGDNAIALSHQLGNIVNTVPFTLIVNQQGMIVHRQFGEISNEKIEEIILPLIGLIQMNI